MPGVSSFTAVAARIGRELTIPEVAQSVILTRLGGGKTPMPPGEQVAEFARHETTMALFLSAARSGQLQDELLAGGYPPDTPCVVAYQVTWPDELIVQTALADLAATIKERKLWKHTLVLVGPGLADRQPLAPVPPRPLPRIPEGRTAGQEAAPRNLETGREHRSRTARARPAADGEGAEAGAAHRLDHRDLRVRRGQGGHHRAGHRRDPASRGGRPARWPKGRLPGRRLHAERRPRPRPLSSRTPATTRT